MVLERRSAADGCADDWFLGSVGWENDFELSGVVVRLFLPWYGRLMFVLCAFRVSFGVNG